MKNQTYIDMGKTYLKELLANCNEAQQLMFKRMYSHQNLDKDINQVVDDMDSEKIDWAISQCEKTVEKNNS
ncbi:hypothetical protein GGR21_002505 [Dysgonomonas hofstadii]|uniref:Uncharacterized protein n=1 Tax=Dysgonomonas hofstadii TaxID=637886 RepID=A0A840CPI9_9BACT|nr:hypothetical protein [Dysgonomonas hofstadii]MBB4036599.1 hypothetical protein [Dysgonomonas hofstadii]